MPELEYLVSYGLAGDFGRFRASKPLTCRRGARVVVRSHRGLEVGTVLRSATARHATFLPNTTVGPLLRSLSPQDESFLAEMCERRQHLFDRACGLAREQTLPLELVDAEVLLDGEHAALHLLRWQESDVRPFVSTLSREFALHLEIVDLAQPKAEEEPHGCGKEGCGSASGGCGSCGTGGGCGSCGSAAPAEEKAHFAQLREQMELKRVQLL